MDAICLHASLANFKTYRHSKIGSLEARGNDLIDNSTRSAALKETNSSQTFVMVQRDIFSADNLDILNCLMDHSRSSKWISYSFPHLIEINVFQSWSVCFFFIELMLSLIDRLLHPL